MFGKKAAHFPAMADEGGETVIGSTTNFQGIVKSDSTVRIYGIVEGEVETAGVIYVGKTAKILANLTAHEVQVAGAIKGNVTASGSVAILEGAQVHGDVVSPSLMIEAGAIFSGQSIVRGTNGDKRLLEAPAESEPEHSLAG